MSNLLPQYPLLGVRSEIKSVGSVFVAVPLLEDSGIALVVRTATQKPTLVYANYASGSPSLLRETPPKA